MLYGDTEWLIRLFLHTFYVHVSADGLTLVKIIKEFVHNLFKTKIKTKLFSFYVVKKISTKPQKVLHHAFNVLKYKL